MLATIVSVVKKYTSLIAAIVVQIALGGIYAYSIYVPSFQNEWGFSSSQTQLVFGLTVFLFTVFMIYSGRKLVVYGPRRLLIISALLYTLGYLLVANSGGAYPLFFAGYTFFIAPAIAFGYVCAVSTGLLWFPSRKGLVTGLAVAGYGLGGVLMSAVAEGLLQKGWTIQAVLTLVGLAWGGAIFVSGLVSSTPPSLIAKHQKPIAKQKIQRNPREFSALVLYLFAGTMPGLMLIGALKPFALDSGVAVLAAATGVALLSFGNGFGRILWGALADRVSPRKLTSLNIATIIVSIGALFAVSAQPFIYLPASLLLGFGFGGPLVLAPDQVGRVFGARNLSQIYPWTLLAHGVAAAVGAGVAGIIYQSSGSYRPVLVLAIVSATLGLLGYNLLTRHSRKLA